MLGSCQDVDDFSAVRLILWHVVGWAVPGLSSRALILSLLKSGYTLDQRMVMRCVLYKAPQRISRAASLKDKYCWCSGDMLLVLFRLEPKSPAVAMLRTG